jgi:adenylate kinase
VSVYIMIGAPGAGKGTQADILSERLALPHIASGELFREAMRDGTALGRELESYVSRGALVPDDLSTRVVLNRLARADAKEGAILDGFPRTRPQAEALDEALDRQGKPIAAAFYVGVSEAELMRRLAGRWVCRAAGHVYHEVYQPPRVPGICDEDGSELYHRVDDLPATVRARLEQQLPPMYEVVDYYNDRGILTCIDGERSIDEVAEALLSAIRRQPVAPRQATPLRRVVSERTRGPRARTA